MRKAQSPVYSKVCKTEVVCPNDTNPMGILQGGRLVQWMDIAAAVCAQTHAAKICVTASMDTVSFTQPAHVGDIITMEAKITRAFTTSMEIKVTAWSRSVFKTRKSLISESYFTFVAIDQDGKVAAVNGVKPSSATEKSEYEAAAKRRNHKLNPHK
ncbi:MAG TPA: acyl-CoA thioesterase [Cytophagales bacterium]|nr:acyl-CoA thioesterase [Cytophagales bacterium]